MLSLARERPIKSVEMQLITDCARALVATLHFAGSNIPSQEAVRLRRVLSARELAVLTLAARGFSSPQIADNLKITARTVNFHVGSVMKKMGVRNRSAAIAKAAAIHLVSASPQAT